MDTPRSGVLDIVPPSLGEAAAAALAAVDAAGAPGTALTGGASGALIFRVEAPTRPVLLRLETARDPFRDPRRTYPVMAAAAELGVAPAVHHADADAGTVVMDFIDQRPLTRHPGGQPGIVAELGSLIATLQRSPAAPPLLEDFGALLERMLEVIAGSGLFADGVLEPVGGAFATIRAAYPWNADPQVASHNDVNEHNVLFDGDRLWLIDWELAFRNDRFADIAIVANNVAVTADLETRLLRHWLGRPPSDSESDRLTLMRALSRLFYGCLMLSTAIGRHPQEADLTAPTPDEFRAAFERGEHSPANPATLHTLGKMQLSAFVAGMSDRAVRDAIATTAR